MKDYKDIAKDIKREQAEAARHIVDELTPGLREAAAVEAARVAEEAAAALEWISPHCHPDNPAEGSLPESARYGCVRSLGGLLRWVDLEAQRSYVLLPAPSPAQLAESPRACSAKLIQQARDMHLETPPPEIVEEVLMLAYRHYNCQPPGGASMRAPHWAQVDTMNFIRAWSSGVDRTGVARRYAFLAPLKRGIFGPDRAIAALRIGVLVDHKPATPRTQKPPVKL